MLLLLCKMAKNDSSLFQPSFRPNNVNLDAISPTFLLIDYQLRVETHKESILQNVPKLNIMYRFTTTKCIAIHDLHFLRVVSALTQAKKYAKDANTNFSKLVK